MADLDILRSDKLTFSLYFSQQAEISYSVSDFNITFADADNKIINLTLTSWELTPYFLKFYYSYDELNFINVYLRIPYLDSMQSDQAISVSSYTNKIYYFNNYEADKE